MKVSVIGLGYVGLPLLCAIQKLTKHKVVGFDISKSKIEKISKGICPVDDIQCQNDMKELKLEVSDKSNIIADSDIYIICVPTPVMNNYIPDLNPLKSAVETIKTYLKKGQTIVIESTINPGVCDEVVTPIIEKDSELKAGIDFDVAHCPERINPGDEKWNVYNIPRNIGSTNPKTTAKLAKFYGEFVDAEINEMPDLKTAEATKIIENTFRDINIAFVNELAKSFDVLGIDLMAVIKGASNKPFAFMPHYPSCGVGGHCIPVDPYYLIERAKESGFDHKFLKRAREINKSMPAYTIGLLSDALNEKEKSIKNTNIGLYGLSYKADVADIRESPSIELRKLLEEKGANLTVWDPYFTEYSTSKNFDEFLDNCFAIVIATNHKELLQTEISKFKEKGIQVIIDGKNCLKKEEIITQGIFYKGIGT